MPAPTSWRIICARSASVPRRSWGCASSARSTWWSALLGILKAGGAYLPLDPPTRPSGWPSCSTMPARRCWSHRPRCASACPTARRQHRPARRRRCRHRTRSPRTAPARTLDSRTTPPTSSTPQAPPEYRKASRSRISSVAQLFDMHRALVRLRCRRRLDAVPLVALRLLRSGRSAARCCTAGAALRVLSISDLRASS